MRAYFTASLRGKQNFEGNYREIVKTLQKIGVDVFADHILNEKAAEVAVSQTDEQKKKFYHKLFERMKSVDLVVAEISTPSVSVGHEISFALEIGKVVLVLYTEGNGSILLEGSNDRKLKLIEYSLESLPKILPKAVEEAKKSSDVRFNFFISPDILSYLDWVSQYRKVPRSVFLRELIEKEMKKDKEFTQ